MAGMKLGKYVTIFEFRSFKYFWLGLTLSTAGDVMTRVALTWFVWNLTQSPRALGLLALAYTGPVVAGGLIAGPILDRYDRRKVILLDSVFRGAVVLLIPLFHALGILALWHVYLVAAVYGVLLMIPLAGGPSLVPDLVDEEHLHTANALETLSFTLSNVAGPPMAGLLIPLLSAPNVVIVDAASYFLFALALIRVHVPEQSAMNEQKGRQTYHLKDAVRLLLTEKILLSTTLMFMAANLGLGGLLVWLPILADEILGGGPQLFGLLLGVLAVGEVSSSFLAGTLRIPLKLGAAICATQALAGFALALMAVSLRIPIAIISLALFGFFSAPLTIWAQTLRMKIIPAPLRGRTFALLRTMMQSANPLGGAAAGLILPLLTMPLMIAVSATVIGVPGLLGSRVSALRSAD